MPTHIITVYCSAKEMGKLEELLRKILNSTKMESYGRAGGGCINEGEGFMTDTGPIFVKKNRKSEVLNVSFESTINLVFIG